MKRRKFYLSIILGIVLVFLIVLGIRVYSDYRIGFQEVYIANKTLKQRRIIREEDLTVLKVPKDYIRKEIYIVKEDIVGKVLKMNHSLVKGSYFYKEALEDFNGQEDLLHLYLNEDEVTFDMSVSEVKVNPLYLKVGMVVNLYLTIQADRVISDLLMSDVKIIGLFEGYQKNIDTISIAVSKEDVTVLNKAITLGTLSIIVGEDSYKGESKATLIKDSEIYRYLEYEES